MHRRHHHHDSGYARTSPSQTVQEPPRSDQSAVQTSSASMEALLCLSQVPPVSQTEPTSAHQQNKLLGNSLFLKIKGIIRRGEMFFSPKIPCAQEFMYKMLMEFSLLTDAVVNSMI